MATPFAPFANARLAWQRPTAPLMNLRDGFRPAETETVVLEAFLEPDSGGSIARADGEQRAPASVQTSQERALAGYITRWAVVPDGEGWLDAGTGWTWDDTGLRPHGMGAGRTELQAALVKVSLLPATDRAEIGTIVLDQLGSPYGPGGVGERITSTAGEYLAGRFSVR